MLIGVAGLKGSGKSTAGEILQQITGAETTSFAYPIKNIAKDLFFWDDEDLNGSFKETSRKCTIKNWKNKIPSVLKSHDNEFKSISDENIIKLFKNKVVSEINGKCILNSLLLNIKRDLTLEISPRRFFQLFGTNLARSINDNIWINNALNKYKKESKLIITDVRFDNEAQAIIDKGGKIIRIKRETEIYSTNDTHQSELGINNKLVSATILNDGTIIELEDAIQLAMDLVICSKKIL